MDALFEVHNEDSSLRDVGLLQSSSVLATRSSVARQAAPVPLASPLVAPPGARDVSADLHYDNCGRDEHVDAFCYRKRKAQKTQTRRSSHGTRSTGSRGSEMSSGSSET
jgi:hypothetical protein